MKARMPLQPGFDRRRLVRAVVVHHQYFVRRGWVIVVMLNAGGKSTQKRDIRQALKLASQLGDDL